MSAKRSGSKPSKKIKSKNPGVKHPGSVPDQNSPVRKLFEQGLEGPRDEQEVQLANELDVSPEALREVLAKIALKSSTDKQVSDFVRRNQVEILRDAVAVFGPEDGLQFLKQVGPVKLGTRIQSIEFLMNVTPLICSISELRNHLKNFQGFLDSHKNSIIGTGLPPRTFRDCLWLHTQLGRLYDTRRSREPFPPDYFRGSTAAKSGPAYIWIRSVPGLRPPDEVQECSYLEADFLPSLKRDHAERLENLRERFFKTRMAVLGEITCAFENEDASGLADRCFRLIRADFNQSELEFFIQSDKLYLDFGITALSNSAVHPKWSPGGLTNLLILIGHVVSELQIGVFSHVRDSAIFRSILRFRDDNSRYFPYFSMIQGLNNDDEYELAELDNALDCYCSDAFAETKFWKAFGERAITELVPDARTVVGVEVGLKLRDQMRALLQSAARYHEADPERLGAVGSNDLDGDEVISRRIELKQRLQVDVTRSKITFDRNTVSVAPDAALLFAKIIEKWPEPVQASQVHLIEGDTGIRTERVRTKLKKDEFRELERILKDVSGGVTLELPNWKRK